MSKPMSPELKTLLATRQFYQADLYTFTFQDASLTGIPDTFLTTRYSGGDQDIKANGNLYPCGGLVGPYFDRKDNKSKLHQKIGLDVDTLTFDVLPGTSTLLGVDLFTLVRRGLFDYAELLLERAYTPTGAPNDTTRGTMRMFIGRVAEIDCGRSIATFTVNSHLELLNMQMPRNLYQPHCINSLGDHTCGVDLTNPSYHTTATVAGGASVSQVPLTLAGGPFAAGTFDQGVLQFTSGTLGDINYKATIQTLDTTSGVATILGYLPVVPAVGVTAIVIFGCNKLFADSNGCPKFSNQARYRGMDKVPQPVAAV